MKLGEEFLSSLQELDLFVAEKPQNEQYFKKINEIVCRIMEQACNHRESSLLRDEMITLLVYLEGGKFTRRPFDICIKREKVFLLAKEVSRAGLYRTLAVFFVETSTDIEELSQNHSHCVRCREVLTANTKKKIKDLFIEADTAHYVSERVLEEFEAVSSN